MLLNVKVLCSQRCNSDSITFVILVGCYHFSFYFLVKLTLGRSILIVLIMFLSSLVLICNIFIYYVMFVLNPLSSFAFEGIVIFSYQLLYENFSLLQDHLV